MSALTTEDVSPYYFFWRAEDFLSQWHFAPFRLDDILYSSAEQYMMYHKAVSMKDQNTAQYILGTQDPSMQKWLGKKVQNFDKVLWDSISQSVVKTGNFAKFRQNPNLRVQLLETSGKLLVEASPFDRRWGIGLPAGDERCHDRSLWKGTNWLGFILTEIREELCAEAGLPNSIEIDWVPTI